MTTSVFTLAVAVLALPPAETRVSLTADATPMSEVAARLAEIVGVEADLTELRQFGEDAALTFDFDDVPWLAAVDEVQRQAGQTIQVTPPVGAGAGGEGAAAGGTLTVQPWRMPDEHPDAPTLDAEGVRVRMPNSQRSVTRTRPVAGDGADGADGDGWEIEHSAHFMLEVATDPIYGRPQVVVAITSVAAADGTPLTLRESELEQVVPQQQSFYLSGESAEVGLPDAVEGVVALRRADVTESLTWEGADITGRIAGREITLRRSDADGGRFEVEIEGAAFDAVDWDTAFTIDGGGDFHAYDTGGPDGRTTVHVNTYGGPDDGDVQRLTLTLPTRSRLTFIPFALAFGGG